MRRTARGISMIATTLLAFGCAQADLINPHEPKERVNSLSTAESSEASQDMLGEVLARGMSRPDVRARVLQAMRASPWTEHKLVLQDFLLTPDGKKLLDAGRRCTYPLNAY